VVGYNYVDRFRDRKEKYYSVDKQAHPNWKQLWKFVRTYDYVSGDFMWTGIDYIGESRWPANNSSSGVIDTCGRTATSSTRASGPPGPCCTCSRTGSGKARRAKLSR